MNTDKVTKEYLEELLGQSEFRYHIFWGKEIVVSYKLPSGFAVEGRSACVEPANFVLETGLKIAREEVINKLWKLEGYVLQLKLAEQIQDLRGKELIEEEPLVWRQQFNERVMYVKNLVWKLREYLNNF